MNWFKKLFSSNPKESKPKAEGGTSPLGDSPISSSNPRENKPKVEGASDDDLARLKRTLWFVLEHGKKKEGPFTLEQLRARLQGVSAPSQIRIRKETTGEWCPWVNAGKVFPELAAVGLVEAAASPKSTTMTREQLLAAAKGTSQPPPARAARPPEGGGPMDRQRIPLMTAPGYDIEPFIPPYEWLGQTIMQFYASGKRLRGGRMSFATNVFGIYRFPDMTFNFGLSAGNVIETSSRMVGWQYATDTINGVSVISADFDHVNFTEHDIDVFGTTCRAACLEPWGLCDGKNMLTSGMDQINFYLLWLGKRGQQRVAFHHPSGEWIG